MSVWTVGIRPLKNTVKQCVRMPSLRKAERIKKIYLFFGHELNSKDDETRHAWMYLAYPFDGDIK